MTESQARRTINPFRSVRTQIAVLLLLAVLVPVLVTQYLSLTTTRDTLESETAAELNAIALSSESVVARFLTEQIELMQLLADTQSLEAAAEGKTIGYGSRTQEEILEDLLALDAEWRTTPDGLTTSLTRSVLDATVVEDLEEFQNRFPGHVEVFVTDAFGGLVVASNRTTDYYQADEGWWQAAYNDGLGAAYINPVIQLDESTGISGVQIAVPIVEAGQVVGVLRSTYSLSTLRAELESLRFQDTGRIYVLDNNGQVLLTDDAVLPGFSLPETVPLLARARAEEEEPAGETLNIISDENDVDSVLTFAPLTTNGVINTIDNMGWNVVVLNAESEAFGPVNEAINSLFVPIGAVLLVTLIIGLVFAQQLTHPISVLRNAAQRLAGGDYSTRVPLAQRNEFGQLADVMNVMAERLQAAIQDFERNLEARTQDLQTILDLNNRISTILDLDRLLQDVVDLTKERFNLYHAHIYLLDDDDETLYLAAGAGYVGRQMVAEEHQIDINHVHSIVAQAARTQENVVINDVRESETFLPNPMLPQTRSELAVALVARGRVLGVLDLQSEKINRFTEEAETVFETTADQIAAAVDKTRLYEIAARTSRHEQALNLIAQRLQAASDVDEALEVATRELGKALRVSNTAIELKMSPTQSEN